MAFLSNSDNYNILIKTDSDTKGVKSTEDALRKLGTETDKGGTSFFKLSSAVAAGEAAFTLAKSAISGVTSIVKDSVKAYEDSQNVQALIVNTLASTHNAAGVNLDDLNKQAQALQGMTRYSDEAIGSSQQLLLTFSNIRGPIFKQATESVLDMATAMHMDLSSASVMLGKALNDPIRGITAMSKAGVSFTQVEKDQIKAMVESGNVAGAQTKILQTLAGPNGFKGAAEAAGKTFAGSLERLRNQVNDVQESLGKAVVDGVTPLMQRMSDFVASDKFKKWVKELTDWISDNLPRAINYATNTLLPELKRIFDEIWPVIKTVLKWTGELFEFISNHTWVIWAFAAAFAAVKTAMFLNGALKAFQTVIFGASTSYGGLATLIGSPLVMPALVIVAALASIALVAKAVQTVIGAIDAMNAAAKASESQIQSNIDAANKMYDAANKGQVSLDKLYKSQAALDNTKLVYKSSSNGQVSYLAGFASGGYTGSGGSNDIAGVVHKGEYVLPKEQVNQSTGKPKAQSGSVTTNYNAPIYLTTSEATKEFFRIQDRNGVLAAKGLSVVRI